MRRTYTILLLILIILVSLPGVAFSKEFEGDLLTARELLTSTRGYGLASAMSASASGTSAVWHNPAGIASAMMYSFDASYLYQKDVSGHGFETNIVDMKSNQYVGAGLGFMYQYGKPGDASQHLVHVRAGIGVPLADRLISLGVSGMYTYIKKDGHQILSMGSMDVGLILKPLEWLQIGLTAQNLIVGDYEAYMPRMITAGVAFQLADIGFNAMFDASFNLSADNIGKSGSYAVGLEYILKEFIPIRLGYRFEGEDHHVLTAGLGYRHNEGLFGLDLAYQHHFSDYSNEVFSGAIEFYF